MAKQLFNVKLESNRYGVQPVLLHKLLYHYCIVTSAYAHLKNILIN